MATFIYHFRTDLSKLYEMLALREMGWSYTALAERYNCPKLTIRYLSRKYGLGHEIVTVTVDRQRYLRATTQPSPDVTIGQTEEKICEGKTYAQYLKEEAERKYRRLNPNL
jgi:hypothetical protein